MEEIVTWTLPLSLLQEIEKSFEVKRIETEDGRVIDSLVEKFAPPEFGNYWQCVYDAASGKYYCEKWVNGSKITRGPFPQCPASCK